MRIAIIILVLLSLNYFDLKQTQNTIRPAKIKEAKALFKKTCVRCHGSDGRGQTTKGLILGATDLTATKWQERVDDSRVLNSITHGRAEMPGFENKLTQDQIVLLASYIRTFKTQPVTTK